MKSQAPPYNEFPNGENCNGFKVMHNKMRYNYQIQNAIFAESINSGQELAIQLEVKNIGVSHIYYNWDIQFALLDQDDIPEEVYEVEYDLTKAFSTKSFDIEKTINNISTGNYKLGVRIVQPMADKPKKLSWGLDARNTYILFSNELKVIEGSWKSDNSLKGGWSILGNIKVN